MKSKCLAFVSIILLLTCSESAMACWCRKEVLDTDKKFRAAVAKEIRRSFVVFSGEAVERNLFGLRFKVTRVWKGKPTDEIVFRSKLYAAQSSGDNQYFIDSCALLFDVGKRYLVYGYREGNNLYVSKCSRTQPLENAERDVNELDRLKPGRRAQLALSGVDVGRLRSTAKSNFAIHANAKSAPRDRKRSAAGC